MSNIRLLRETRRTMYMLDDSSNPAGTNVEDAVEEATTVKVPIKPKLIKLPTMPLIRSLRSPNGDSEEYYSAEDLNHEVLVESDTKTKHGRKSKMNARLSVVQGMNPQDSTNTDSISAAHGGDRDNLKRMDQPGNATPILPTSPDSTVEDTTFESVGKRGVKRRSNECAQDGNQSNIDFTSSTKRTAPIPPVAGNSCAVPASKITRLVRGRPTSVKKAPNFAQIHERRFAKMESVNQYVERRKKSLLSYSTSKVARNANHDELRSINEQKQSASSHVDRFSRTSNAIMFESFVDSDNNQHNMESNAVLTKDPKPAWRYFTNNNDQKQPPQPLESFVDSANNQRNMEVVAEVRKDKQRNTMVCGLRPTFNLQASLAKPLSYKPHLGKLKPVADIGLKHQSLASKNWLLPSRVEIRENQRNVVKGVRSNKRFDMLMSRRGVM